MPFEDLTENEYEPTEDEQQKLAQFLISLFAAGGDEHDLTRRSNKVAANNLGLIRNGAPIKNELLQWFLTLNAAGLVGAHKLSEAAKKQLIDVSLRVPGAHHDAHRANIKTDRDGTVDTILHGVNRGVTGTIRGILTTFPKDD